jgi:hypothetical protein
MVAPGGWDPEGGEGSDLAPVSGAGLRRGLAVTDTAAVGALAAAGRGFVRYGGGYAAAAGIGAGLCAAAGIPLYLDLTTVGVCLAHGASRAAEGFSWHRAGGRAAERRRRQWQGEADVMHVRRYLSPSAASKKMARLAPSLPANRAFIPVGVTVHRPAQKVAVSRAETILVTGPPQTIKTALMSNWVLEAPGAVLATSSRADQYRYTAAAREAMGEVLVLDADGHGPGTNFAWDMVSGCADPDIAIRRAGALMGASPRDPGGKDRWHEDRGARLLRLALHAAALAREGMEAVRFWCQNPEVPEFAKALGNSPVAAGWLDSLSALCSAEGEFLNSAITSAEAALGWMDSPALSAVACPEPGEGLDIAAFLRAGRPGTVYLIGRNREYGSLTPFFSVFVTEFMEQARELAEKSGGRLAVPLTIVADEAATTAKINFKEWCAVSAGYNITVVAGLQAMSQLSEWGSADDQETILTLFTTKVIAGGNTSSVELERESFVFGEHPTWYRQGGTRMREMVRTFPPGRIRMLPEFHAVLLHRSAKPVEVVIPPVWNHPACRPLTFTDAPEPVEPDTAEPPEQEASAA